MVPEDADDDPYLKLAARRFEEDPSLDFLHEDDPFLEEILDAAMDGMTHLVPAEVAADIRESVRDMIWFHPEGRRLLRQARPDPSVDRSCNVARRPADPAADPSPVPLAVGCAGVVPLPAFKKRPT